MSHRPIISCSTTGRLTCFQQLAAIALVRAPSASAGFTFGLHKPVAGAPDSEKSQIHHLPRLFRVLACFMVSCVLTFIVATPVRAADNDSQVERSMDFVEQTMEATERLNDGKVQEALSAFQELLASYGDLDEDGFVAMAVGDCLMQLKRFDESRVAYEEAAASHPGLAERIDERLTELELAGTVTDQLLDKLRRAAGTTDDSRYVAYWYLARALQKRAHDLLNESLDAFDQATLPGSPIHRCTRKPLYSAYVEDLTRQLGSWIEQLENRWNKIGQSIKNGMAVEDEYLAGATITLNQHGEWTVIQGDDRTMAFEVQQKNDGPCRFTADGKPITLTQVQSMLIRHHQDRINAILIEALNKQSSSPERREP